MGTFKTTWETIRLELPHCATIAPREVTRLESAQKAGTTKQSRPSGQLQSYRSTPSWTQAPWVHYPLLTDEELNTEELKRATANRADRSQQRCIQPPNYGPHRAMLCFQPCGRLCSQPRAQPGAAEDRTEQTESNQCAP